MIACLSGPIENAENDGADWRKSLTPWIKNKLNHKVFNPVIATRDITKGLTSSEFRNMKRSNPDKYKKLIRKIINCLLYTSPSPRDRTRSRMPSSA